MTARILIYIVVIWIIFTVANIIDARFADIFASPTLGQYGGHICSMLRLLGFMLIVVYLFVKFMEIQHYSINDLLFIGFCWLAMTGLYEFIYMHYFRHRQWSRIFRDYNIMDGRLKILLLLTQLLAPLLLGLWENYANRMSYRHDQGDEFGLNNNIY